MQTQVVQLQFQTLGYSNVVKIFVVILTLFAKARALFKNFSYQALLGIGFEILQYGDILKLGRQAIDEFKTFNPEKAKQARTEIKEQFDIEDDKLEAQLEDALDLIVETYDLFMRTISLAGKWSAYVGQIFQKEQLQAA